MRVLPLTARGRITWDASRAGQRWDAKELERLRQGREDGYTVRELAIAHQRTPLGILTALEAIGAIPSGFTVELPSGAPESMPPEPEPRAKHSVPTA